MHSYPKSLVLESVGPLRQTAQLQVVLSGMRSTLKEWIVKVFVELRYVGHRWLFLPAWLFSHHPNQECVMVDIYHNPVDLTGRLNLRLPKSSHSSRQALNITPLF